MKAATSFPYQVVPFPLTVDPAVTAVAHASIAPLLSFTTVQDTRRPHNDQQQVYNTLKGRLNPLPDRISSGARHLILSMLQTDPARRPSLQEIAAHPCLVETDMHEAFQYEVRLSIFSAVTIRIDSPGRPAKLW